MIFANFDHFASDPINSLFSWRWPSFTFGYDPWIFLNSSSVKKVGEIPRQEFCDLLGIASQMFDRRHIGSIVRQSKPLEDSILSIECHAIQNPHYSG